MYEFGTLVLIPFPFTDLTASKVRPAMIVSRTNSSSEDLVLAFITSNTGHEGVGCFLLKQKEAGFEKTGLKVDSIFRFDKLATLHKKLILGELGKVSEGIVLRMKKSFSEVFGF